MNPGPLKRARPTIFPTAPPGQAWSLSGQKTTIRRERAVPSSPNTMDISDLIITVLTKAGLAALLIFLCYGFFLMVWSHIHGDRDYWWWP